MWNGFHKRGMVGGDEGVSILYYIGIMIFLLLFGLAFLLLSLVYFFKMKKISRNGIKTEGIIFDVEARPGYKTPYPVIRFLTTEKVWITQIPGFWTNARIPTKGEKVNIIYNPDNPTDFVVEGKPSGALAFIFIGLAFILLWGFLTWRHVQF